MCGGTTDQKGAEGEVWAIVEVMGHSRYAGRVSESQQFGAPLIRVEVPAVGEMPAYEKHLGAASIFAITPVSEEFARRAAAQFCSRPFTLLDVPDYARLPSPDRDEGPDDDDMEY